MEEQIKKEEKEKPIILTKIGQKAIPTVSVQFVTNYLQQMSNCTDYTITEISSTDKILSAIEYRIANLIEYLNSEAKKAQEKQ